MSDFICITLSELYRKSADIFPDSRAYIATFLSCFILIDFSMKADPGNRIPNRKLDEALEGKGMSIVNVYWFCLLALEYVALFCQSYLQTSWNSWIIALWIIAMIGNVFAAVYCIRTF